MVDPSFDYQFRLILIGDSTVGKSSLLKSFAGKKHIFKKVILLRTYIQKTIGKLYSF